MRKIFFVLKRSFLAIVAFLFPASCIPAVMYGAPIATGFQFKTTDTNSEAIPGLELKLTAGTSNVTTLTTDSNGQASYYYLYGYSTDDSITTPTNLTLTVTDTDGTNNGGEFSTVTTNLNVSIADYTIIMK